MSVAFAGLNMLAYNHARTMMQFSSAGMRTGKPEKMTFWSKARVLLAGLNIPRPESNLDASVLASGSQVLSIKESDNVTLETWYCNRGKETPLVILFHGYTAEKTSLLVEAKAFLDLGNSVLLVDFRGSGGSSESYTTIGIHEAEDVVAVLQYVREHLSHRKLILFGQSMGAAAILRAVAKHNIQPDAVILEAVFDSMLNAIRNRFHTMKVPSFPSAELLVFWGGRQWGFNGFRHNPAVYASSLDCPVLFMHGIDDFRATLAEGRRVFDAVGSPKEFITFEETGHESYASSRENKWRVTVGDFVEEICQGVVRGNCKSPASHCRKLQ